MCRLIILLRLVGGMVWQMRDKIVCYTIMCPWDDHIHLHVHGFCKPSAKLPFKPETLLHDLGVLFYAVTTQLTVVSPWGTMWEPAKQQKVQFDGRAGHWFGLVGLPIVLLHLNFNSSKDSHWEEKNWSLVHKLPNSVGPISRCFLL